MINNIIPLEIKKYFKLRNALCIIFISLYASFACFVEELFFKFTYVEISAKNFIIIFGCALLWFLIIIGFLYVLELFNNKISKNKFEIKNTNYIILFFATFIVWLICLILYWPGIITPDSISQHLQAIGSIPLSDHHNIIHTLFLRIIYNINDNFSLAIFVQIFFASIIWAYCIGSFSNKINIKYLVLFSLIFAALPNTAKTVISLWKDIPYTFSFLLLIFVLSKNNKTIISSKKFSFLFILSFSLVALLRHNGIFVVLGTILVYLIISKFEKKIFNLIAAVFLIIAFVQYPLMNYYHVIPISNWTKHITMYNDLVGVLLAKGDLSINTKSFLEKEITINEHRKIYTPYVPAMYVYPKIREKFLYSDLGLNSINTTKLLHIYVDTLKKNPTLIIQNRLLSSDVLWNCAPTKEYYSPAFNYLVHGNVINNNILIKKESSIKQVVKDAYKSVKNTKIYIALFEKTGIYIIFIFIICLFALENFNLKSLIIFIPIFFQALGLLLVIQAQDYRYVWPIFVSFWYILLFSITKNKTFR